MLNYLDKEQFETQFEVRNQMTEDVPTVCSPLPSPQKKFHLRYGIVTLLASSM